MTFTRKVMTFAAVLATAGFVSVSGLQAQDGQMNQQMMQEQMQQQPAKDYSNAKLEAYVDSAGKIQNIYEQKASDLEAAGSEEQKQAVYMEMQKEMISIIQDTENITVAEYNQISQAARQNDQLAERLRSMLNIQ